MQGKDYDKANLEKLWRRLNESFSFGKMEKIVYQSQSDTYRCISTQVREREREKMCVCVRERKRERDSESEREKEIKRE